MKRPIVESLFIEGPEGRLQASLEAPPGAFSDAVAVVCHPHPLYHGTMDNKVVHTISRTVNRLGRPSVRFNFRGVGESESGYGEGIGETEDVIAVAEWARQHWPAAELWLAGFSFGAYVALRASANLAPACLVTVAPPVHRFPVADQGAPACPWLVIQGEDDELVDSGAVEAWTARLQPRPEVRFMASTDHFFHGRLRLLGETLASFLRSRAPACEDA